MVVVSMNYNQICIKNICVVSCEIEICPMLQSSVEFRAKYMYMH